ncbi:hypothetical protein B0T22DRAFT_480371 [Podospora appendiculata]|uniref:Uncharacterized protein n=1 Tax=Podospora appendiculata TaxID=314037 RepID=A0AAE0XBA5_9PEZI|nr:hypothetical protein B0T22DRAFT_480371 [Podospora appendiculata]
MVRLTALYIATVSLLAASMATAQVVNDINYIAQKARAISATISIITLTSCGLLLINTGPYQTLINEIADID